MGDQPIKFQVRPGVVLTILIVWCYIVQRIAVPVSYSWVYLAALVGILALGRLYSGFTLSFTTNRSELGVLLGLVVLNIALHWNALFYSLAGDELYHVDRALPLTAIFNALSPTLSGSDMSLLRSSIWRIFDPRHLQVIDLWRMASFLALTVVAAIYLYFSKAGCAAGAVIRAGYRWWLVGVLILVAVVYGEFSQQPAESHPPLRLFPLFLSNTIFGLNPFASRIPGVLLCAFTSWLLFVGMRRLDPVVPVYWSGLIGATAGFIPVVFYSSEVVEPSILGFSAYVSVMLAVVFFLRSSEPRFLIAAAILATIGALSRQPSAILWLLVALSFLLKRGLWSFRNVALVFAPALVLAPYLYSVSQIGHVAVASSEGDKLTLLARALQSGTALMSVLNSCSLPWVVVSLVALCFVLLRHRWWQILPLVLFPVAFCLYHTIWPYLWGMGRYQAEYIAPFMAFVIWLAASYLPSRARLTAAAVLGLACLTTFEHSANSSLDINFQNWPQRRLSTGANFPYRDALGQLKREESLGDFVMLEGSPIYGKMVLWQNGFSFWESARWQAKQGVFDGFMTQRRPQERVRELMIQNQIKALVVQSGTRRELQHRINPHQAELQASLEVIPLDGRNYFYKHAVFHGEHGGILTIYKPRS